MKRLVLGLLVCALPMTACATSSSGPDSPTPSPTPTIQTPMQRTPTTPAPVATSSALPHQARAGEPPLLPVPGYRYEDFTARQVDAFADMGVCEQLDSQHPGVCVSESGHNVHGLNAGWISIVEFGLDPEHVPDGFATSWTDGYARKCESEGATVEIQTMSTERVVHASLPDGHLYAWFHDDVITIVVGAAAGDTEAFAAAYLLAARSV